ncbi:MAG: U32 family peptidase [Candidatus Omnitrophica bacterium]|nr:U32 family peptidase [Candidatus Omnitrophota bacterium]
MLKITAPFREKEEVVPLIEAGANTLYCGYLSLDWVKKYTALEFERKGGGSNFTDLLELEKAVNLAHKKNTPVFLTLNGLYVKEQYPLLLKIVKQLEKIDLDGYIVADIGLLLTLKENGLKKQISISTGGTVFNSEAVNFYKNLGATRIVLDRQTDLETMKTLSLNHPDIDFEVFILYTLCVYIDGFCTFLHTQGRELMENISRKEWLDTQNLSLSSTYDPDGQADACCLNYSLEVIDSGSNKKLKTNAIRPAFYKQSLSGVECGACTIYDISKSKVKSIKIVGRHLSPQDRLQGTKFIHSVLGILKNNNHIGKQDFIIKTQELYRKTFGYEKKCLGNNCYHPEIL